MDSIEKKYEKINDYKDGEIRRLEKKCDKYKEKIKEIMEGVKKLNISSVYYPERVNIDRQKQTLTITGKRTQVASGVTIEKDLKNTYIITYSFNNGRFYIEDISEGVKK